jgi:hypothetical protein
VVFPDVEVARRVLAAGLDATVVPVAPVVPLVPGCVGVVVAGVVVVAPTAAFGVGVTAGIFGGVVATGVLGRPVVVVGCALRPVTPDAPLAPVTPVDDAVGSFATGAAALPAPAPGVDGGPGARRA